jgi:hypothetical protein
MKMATPVGPIRPSTPEAQHARRVAGARLGAISRQIEEQVLLFGNAYVTMHPDCTISVEPSSGIAILTFGGKPRRDAEIDKQIASRFASYRPAWKRRLGLA